LQYGHDVVVSSYSYLSWLFWLLGFPDQALEASRQAALRGKQITHANSKAFAILMGTTFLQQFLNNPNAVKAHTHALIELCDQMGLPFWRAYGQVLAGWAEVKLGQGEYGLSKIQMGLVDLQSTGTGLHLPYLLGRLTEAQVTLGLIEEAQQTI